WEQVVVSLQTVLIKHLPPFVVGGKTALELQGFAHYLSHEFKEVHLYGPQPPPKWLHLLPLSTKFVVHKNNVLFKNEPNTRGLSHVRWNIRTGQAGPADPIHGESGLPGPMDWFMTVSTPERAYLELLDELPRRETFHQADVLMEGMARLSPRRLQALLEDCRSVKVKRLFFFFADRHQHPWRKHLKKDNIDFGQGKRMLVKGGVLDKTYEITVPEELHGPRRQL
ncbi:MAG: type IV toxin-antitoxin system AbiEi family antitoxin domain-containing protein, partial [Rhodospirillaceae bacterium]|nr:type IV toxin-antitoxin system AbiEi family antitoxin domain-containing protein [Rhodospirillaceae bacterium]